jgi:hypothetical protein
MGWPFAASLSSQSANKKTPGQLELGWPGVPKLGSPTRLTTSQAWSFLRLS